MQRSPWASSPIMSVVSRISWCLAACLTVSGCTQIVDFDRSKIADDTKDGAMPRDSGMDGGGGKDSGPKDSGMKDTGVDSGPDTCDPVTHEGCALNQLCCAVDAEGTLGCLPTSLGQCEACGVACDANVANDCTERTCGCGWMSKAECSGATPRCDAAQGECVECVGNSDCAGNADGEYCFIPTATADAKDNTCVACDRANNAGCNGTTPICNDAAICEACTANPNNCGGGLVCLTTGPSAGACQCATDADCTTPNTPICGTTKICVACTNSTQCNSKKAGDVCHIPSGVCGKPAGASCAAAAECANNLCVDNVCCNDACEGTCRACSAAKKGTGADGTCGPISATAANPDPDNECAGTLSCNGAGACEKVDGAVCTLDLECESGFCTDGVCCNSACDGTCFACSAAKKGAGNDGVCEPISAAATNRDPDNECAGSLSCNGFGACEKGLGVACSGGPTGPECQSGFCADGVCCDEACGGTCRACTAARKGSGTNGTCGDIAAGTDPAPEECPGADICNGSGACVECVGDGNCASVVGRPYCNAGSCVACLDSDDCTTAAAPICTSNACVGCTNDTQCGEKEGTNNICSQTAPTVGQCGTCDPADSAECTTDDDPICDATTLTCGACTSDAQCASRGGTDVICAMGSGQCGGCDPARTAETCTDALLPVCSPTTLECVVL